MKFKIRLSIYLAVVAVFAGGFIAKAGLLKAWGGVGDDAANGIAVDASTNIYTAGGFYGTNVDFNTSGSAHSNLTARAQDAFLCKYSKDGVFQWARSWGGTGADRVNSVAADSAGNVYVLGNFQSTVDFNPQGLAHTNITASGQDVFLCKYNAGGDFLWVRTWGGAEGEDAYTVAVDPTGGVYAVGDYGSPIVDFNPAGPVPDVHTNSYCTPAVPYGYDAWLCKYDSNGNFQWARTWGGNGYDDCCSLAVDGLGNVYTAGFFGSTGNTCDFNAGTNIPHSASNLNATLPARDVTDVFLSKFNSNGDYQWTRCWGGPHTDAPAGGLAVDGLGNVYVGGYFGWDLVGGTLPHDTVDFNPSGLSHSNLTSKGGSDAFLCKYDSSGNFQWARSWGGANDDVGERPSVDVSGYVYVPGVFKSAACNFDTGTGTSSYSSHGNNDIFLSKFDANGNFILAKACGGAGDDWALASAVDGSGNAYLSGRFQGTVDFGPLCDGPSTNSKGGYDAFFCSISTSSASDPSVPTLSQWALVLLAGLVVVIAARRLMAA